MNDCKECEGIGWINVSGAKTIPTHGMDTHRKPCPACRSMVPVDLPFPPPAAYQPEALALLGRTVVAVEQAAARAEPTAEETATWEAEKAAQVARAEAHKAHLDRAEERALKTLAIEERKVRALEELVKIMGCIADRMPQ
jgi:hypothetical protein